MRWILRRDFGKRVPTKADGEQKARNNHTRNKSSTSRGEESGRVVGSRRELLQLEKRQQCFTLLQNLQSSVLVMDIITPILEITDGGTQAEKGDMNHVASKNENSCHSLWGGGDW